MVVLDFLVDFFFTHAICIIVNTQSGICIYTVYILDCMFLNNQYMVYFAGIFVCTDKDKNVILGSCQEFLKTSGMIFTFSR